MGDIQVIAWREGWKSSLETFNTVKATQKIISRKFFQNNGVWIGEYIFDNGKVILIPMDILEV